MKKFTILWAALMAGLCFVGIADASQAYKVQVTRKGQDLYSIEGLGRSVYIKTAYCYEYATWQDAVLILNMQAFPNSIAIGRILFNKGRTSCQVDTILN